jgi:hypothetical protein
VPVTLRAFDARSIEGASMTDVPSTPPPPPEEPPPPSSSPPPPPPGPASVPPPPAYPGAVPGGVPMAKGPIGQARPIGTTILLTIVTCGIYGLYWTYVTFEELKQHNNGRGLGGAVGLIIGIFVGVVNMFILPSEIKTMYEEDGRTSPVEPILGLWFLLPLVGMIIWYVKVQRALNDYWVSKGAAPVG